MEEKKQSIEKQGLTIEKDVNQIQVYGATVETGKEEFGDDFHSLRAKLTNCRITLETCLHFPIPEQVKVLIEKTLLETI